MLERAFRLAKSGCVRVAPSIDDFDAQMLVQQFVVHHKVQHIGRDARVVQAYAYHHRVGGELVVAEFSMRQRLVPRQTRARHRTVEVGRVHPVEDCRQVEVPALGIGR